MARGNKTGGRDIEKGEVLNPKGLNAIPKEVRDARKLNKAELALTISKYLYAPVEDVIAVADYNPADPWPEDEERPRAIDVIVCALIKRAGVGDYLAFNLILERSIGRVPLKDNLEEIDNPVLEHLKKISSSPVATRKEIDQLIKNRDLIEAEKKDQAKEKTKPKK